MKYHLRTIGRIFLFLVGLLLFSVTLHLAAMILFIFLKKYLPFLEFIEYEVAHLLIIILLLLFNIALAIGYISFPLLHIIRWLIQLSHGVYKEPSSRWKFRFGLYFFKDLFHHMERLTERLQASEKERKQFEKQRQHWITGISHDLKTPLAYIKGYASMMSSYRWSETEVKQFSRQIEAKIEEVEEWMKELSLFVSADQQTLPLEKERISLPDFVRKIVLDLANSPLAEGMHLSFSSKPNRFFLLIDPRFLHRSLQNLLINAVIHNPAGTSIDVSVVQKKDHVCIQLKDNGVGINQEVLKALSDAPAGIPNNQPSPKRNGLGLMIAKQLIAAQQGKLEIESEEGQGTTIRILLPTSDL